MTDETPIEQIAFLRCTKISPGVFRVSSPGDDERIRERFGRQLRERADRFFTDAALGEAYEPTPPVPWCRFDPFPGA